MQQPGEPYFLREDTDLAVALAEEERNTCPSCGLLKDWCRDIGSQFAFGVVEEQCHATYTLAAHRNKMAEQRDAATNAATQLAVRFKDGRAPELFAGLDLAELGDDH